MEIRQIIRKVYRKIAYRNFKHITYTSLLGCNIKVFNPDNLIMEEKTNIDSGAVIMNTRAKFIMHKYSGAAIGLTVITGNHMSVMGKLFKEITDSDKDLASDGSKYDKDVIVEEDVWIGANVTLLSGAHIKRGAVIGSGSVVRSTVPPYAIIIGNPSKIVGYRFTPEEVLQHEQILYLENDQISKDYLDRNYNKYLHRVKEISKYLKL